jgi:hypothetical protein
MKTIRFLFTVIIMLIAIQHSRSQNLVQSFIENNIKGDTQFGGSVSRAGDVNNDGYGDVIVGATEDKLNVGRVYIFLGGINMDNNADIVLTGEVYHSYFGNSVSGAGDLNDDGYDDVIVGAYNYSQANGRSYIYFGGSNMDNVADITMTGERSINYFGWSVSGAGDVNSDGYDDVIVGATLYSSTIGRTYIYFGGISMDNVADITMTGEASSNHFGNSVSQAGDVNGDGYDDVIVGAYGFSTNTGRCYIYYGGSSMDNVADVTMTGELSNSNFGNSVSEAGDVNDDGYDDVIVGAAGYSSSTGRSYIYFGGNSMNNVADVTMTGEPSNSNFGNSVSGAGDMNGDGCDDVIVGAYCYSTNIGRSYIYLGGSSMDNVADVTMTGAASNNNFGKSVSGACDLNGDGYDDVIVGALGCSSGTGSSYIYYGGSSMDNVADVTMTGEASDNDFGVSVSGAGDLNGDGYDDVIVGASGYSSNTGRSYIYYGGSNMDNVADITITGESHSIFFGISVSGAGDLNGDGYDDIIVGAPSYSSLTGRCYIYYGGSSMDNVADVTIPGIENFCHFGYSVSEAGDVNDDGYDDVIVGAYGYSNYTGRSFIYLGGSSMDNNADVTMTGEASGNYFGWSVSGAGDLNSDGYDDVIVGAYRYSGLIGRCYIYYGGSSMDNIADVTMTGEASGNYFGCSVSGAGDLNSDGYDDVIVGAYRYSGLTGRCYIYCGGSSMDNVADVVLTGESNSEFGNSVSGAGDLNRDGYDDVIVGDEEYSTQAGRSYIYFGGRSMNNEADVTINGEGYSSSFGHSVSSVGDVNGDGYPEIIVGAVDCPPNGKVYLYNFNPNPNVTTQAATNITFGTATLNGTLTFLGATNPTAHGFCWDTITTPDITGDTINLGAVSATGNFSAPISGLTIGTRYYVRAYATNASGTSYGNEVSFTTLKHDQTITINPLADVTYGDAPFQLSASASSGLPVSYSSSATDVATIVGDTVTIIGAGVTTITATQAGNDTVNAAPPVPQTLHILKAPLSVTAIDTIKDFGIELNFSGFEYAATDMIGSDGITRVVLSSDGASQYALKGTYPIRIDLIIGTGILNYVIDTVDGTMTVEELEIGDTLNVGNILLSSGDNECFSAVNQLLVSSSPSVILQNGATATFIAGSSIRFLPGFYAESGSVMDAYITTDATFCDVVVPKSVSDLSLVAELPQKPSEVKKEAGDIKLYPNPNKGTFTLELSNFEPQATIVIYNLLGERIAQFSHAGDATQPVNLAGIRKGIYMVEVNDGKNRLMKKMIVK